MLEAASKLNLVAFEFTVVVETEATAFLVVALLLLALKDENAKKIVKRHTADVGKKIFFTNLGFFEVIG
jgi:hypothetical protein